MESLAPVTLSDPVPGSLPSRPPVSRVLEGLEGLGVRVLEGLGVLGQADPASAGGRGENRGANKYLYDPREFLRQKIEQ